MQICISHNHFGNQIRMFYWISGHVVSSSSITCFSSLSHLLLASFVSHSISTEISSTFSAMGSSSSFFTTQIRQKSTAPLSEQKGQSSHLSPLDLSTSSISTSSMFEPVRGQASDSIRLFSTIKGFLASVSSQKSFQSHSLINPFKHL